MIDRSIDLKDEEKEEKERVVEMAPCSSSSSSSASVSASATTSCSTVTAPSVKFTSEIPKAEMSVPSVDCGSDAMKVVDGGKKEAAGLLCMFLFFSSFFFQLQPSSHILPPFPVICMCGFANCLVCLVCVYSHSCYSTGYSGHG